MFWNTPSCVWNKSSMLLSLSHSSRLLLNSSSSSNVIGSVGEGLFDGLDPGLPYNTWIAKMSSFSSWRSGIYPRWNWNDCKKTRETKISKILRMKNTMVLKISWKQRFIIEKLPKRWFHEIFSGENEFLVFPLSSLFKSRRHIQLFISFLVSIHTGVIILILLSEWDSPIACPISWVAVCNNWVPNGELSVQFSSSSKCTSLPNYKSIQKRSISCLIDWGM